MISSNLINYPVCTRVLIRVLVTCVVILGVLSQGQRARAEVFFGIDTTGIFSVDTVAGGPTTRLVTFATPLTQAATLAVRPSDGMLFYLDSGNANPNLWRWDPSNPGLAPVLVGTPGATTTGVVRLGFDGFGTLYAMNVNAGATLWTLDPDSGAILTATPSSGDATTTGGDVCLQPGTGALYLVSQSVLYTITPAGVVTRLGTVNVSTGGTIASMPGCAFDSLGRLGIVAGSQVYIVNIGTLTATAMSQTTGAIAFGDLATGPGRKADLRLSQSASNLTPGATVSFTITVTNDGPDRASDVRVLDMLPAGLTLVSATPSKGNYTSGTGVWAIGTLNSGATATLTITANVTVTTPLTNTAQVSYSDLADPDSIPNNSLAGEDDQASVTITPSPDLRIVKTATSSFAVGTNASYSLTVDNTLGSNGTSGVYTVVDNMPSGLTIVGTPSGTGWNCSSSTASQLNCTSSTVIAAGATNANPISLTVVPDIGATPSVTNVASVSGGGEPASNSGNNSSSAVTAVCNAGGCPDLVANKSVPGLTVGSVSTYTLSVTNNGGLTTGANVYTLDDALPTGLTLNAVPSGSNWTCTANNPIAGANTIGGNRVFCSNSTAIAPGGTSSVLTFPVNVANSAVPGVTNSVTVSGGGEPAAAVGNNTTSVTTAVGDFDLTVTKTKTAAGNFVLNVDTATYTLTINNIGSRASTGTYTVTDTLPLGMTLNAGPTAGVGWTCAANTPQAGDNVAGGGRVVCTNSTSLAATTGVSTTIVFPVRVRDAAAPNVTNTATVSNPTEAVAFSGNNSSSVTTAVNAPDLIVTKSHNGNFIVGANGVYTITVHNIGALTTSTNQVVVTDNLPAGVTFVSAAGTNWTCAANTPAAGDNVVGGSRMVCTRPAANAIAANASTNPIVLTVAVTAGAVPGVTNPVSVSGGNEPANNGGNNTDSDFTAAYVAPQIAKSFAPASVVAGVPSTLTITISNPGSNTVALTGLSFSDPLPAGMSVAPTPNFSNSCGGMVSPGQNSGDSLIALAGGGPVVVGGSCIIRVDVVGTTAGSLVNTTGAISSGNSGIGTTASATLTVTSPGSPMLSKLTFPDPVGVNQNTLLTFTITNKATATNNMGFTDTLPANVVVANPATFGGTCASTVNPALVRTAVAGGNTITVTGVDMAAGAAPCTVTINITSSVPGSYNNTSANISALAGGLLATNVNDTLNVRGTTLTKAFTPSSIPANGTSTLTFTLTNGIGNPTQNGLAFTETLPAGVTVQSAPLAAQCNGTVTAVAGGNTITLAGGNMSLGQATCTVAVDVTSAVPATYTNLPANLSGLSTGMTNAIPVGGVALVVNPPPQLATSFSPAEVGAGQTSVLTFTINNSAGNPAQNGLGFTDTLPANLVLADGITSSSCNGTLSDASNNPLAANATSIKLAGGSLAGGSGSCTITVNVKSIVPAVYTNSTAAGNLTAATGGLSLSGTGAVLTVRGTTLTKAFSPGTANINEPVALTFTITNSGGNPAQSGLSFTDTLGGLTLGAVPASPQCGGTVTGSVGGNVAGFSGGSLGPGVASCTVVYSVVAATEGTYTNNAANMSALSAGMTNSVNATLTANRLPSLTKAFSAATAPIGQSTPLVFTITNPASAPPRTGLALTDTLPAGLTIANPTAPTSTCNPLPTYTAVDGTQPFTASNFGIPAGPSTCTITVYVKGTTLGIKTNGATQITSSTGLKNDVTDQTVEILGQPLLAILKSVNLGNAASGQTVVYTVQISNSGTGDGTNVILRDELSPYAYFSLDSYGPGTSFSFTDSSPASGLTLGTPEYSSDGGSTWTYIPLSGNGGAPAGHDGNVTNWRIPMVGTIRTGGSFILNYQVMVK